jgi:hypothetical protein
MKLFIRTIFVVLLYLLSFGEGKAQYNIETSVNINGYWTEWQYTMLEFNYKYRVETNTLSEIVLYKSYYNPWEWCMRITIDYKKPSRKECFQHKSRNEWYEFDGTIEYWVNEEYPTSRELCKSISGYPHLNEITGKVKRTASARIRIPPFSYRQGPRVLNIWFDDIALAVCLGPKWPGKNIYVVK